MKYSRFEDLPAWNAAIELSVRVYNFTKDGAWVRQGSLREQIERASVSISNNIAEGFERGTPRELLTYLYIARGSAGEVRSMLCLAERLPAFSNLKSQISDLRSLAENISRQLHAWASSLQDNPLRGQRSADQKSRRPEEMHRGRKGYIEPVKRVQGKS